MSGPFPPLVHTAISSENQETPTDQRGRVEQVIQLCTVLLNTLAAPTTGVNGWATIGGNSGGSSDFVPPTGPTTQGEQGGSAIPLGNIDKPFITALLSPPVAKHPNPIPKPLLTVTERIRAKIEQIRTSPKVRCYRCGDEGHQARVCRNALRCFACDGFGHKASHCRQFPNQGFKNPDISVPSRPNPNPRKGFVPLNTTTFPENNTKPTEMSLLKFNSNPSSQELEAAFRRSVVLYESEGWSRDRLLEEVRQLADFQWRVAELGDGGMAVEGPRWWRERALAESRVLVGGKELQVMPYLGHEAGLRLKSVWLKITGFPPQYWSSVEFERLIDSFGVLFEVDPCTRGRISFKEARLRVGVIDPQMVPAFKDIIFKNGLDEWRWSRVTFTVETPGVSSETKGKKRKVWIRKPNGSDPTSIASTSGVKDDSDTLMASDPQLEDIPEASVQNQKGVESVESGETDLVDLLSNQNDLAIVVAPQVISNQNDLAIVVAPQMLSPIQQVPVQPRTTRQSLRQKLKAVDVPITEKAIELVKKKNLEVVDFSGTESLFAHFPFNEYSDEQVLKLFNCCNLHLADTESESIACVQFLKELTRKQFTSAIEEMKFRAFHGAKF